MSQLSIPGGVQSTVTSMSVCLSACISQKPNSNTTPNLLCMLTVAVVQSSYDSTAIYFIRTIIYKSQENYLITLTFRSHHETFIRRSWYSVPPDLYVTISCHIKKMVVGMTHLIAALITIYRPVAFLADMYWFLDPSESCLRPISWCNSWSSHQYPEELSTSFFWWRSRDEKETSK